MGIEAEFSKFGQEPLEMFKSTKIFLREDPQPPFVINSEIQYCHKQFIINFAYLSTVYIQDGK